jgi:hypothetical protein
LPNFAKFLQKISPWLQTRWKSVRSTWNLWTTCTSWLRIFFWCAPVVGSLPWPTCINKYAILRSVIYIRMLSCTTDDICFIW